MDTFLKDAGTDRKAAQDSLKEENEAIRLYTERMNAATDPALYAILKHNRDEEVEHARRLQAWLG